METGDGGTGGTSTHRVKVMRSVEGGSSSLDMVERLGVKIQVLAVCCGFADRIDTALGVVR
jgi:hypothetical protein